MPSSMTCTALFHKCMIRRYRFPNLSSQHLYSIHSALSPILDTANLMSSSRFASTACYEPTVTHRKSWSFAATHLNLVRQSSSGSIGLTLKPHVTNPSSWVSILPRQSQTHNSLLTTFSKPICSRNLFSRSKKQKLETKALQNYGEVIYEGSRNKRIRNVKFMTLISIITVLVLETGIILRLSVFPAQFGTKEWVMAASTGALSLMLVAMPIYLNKLTQRVVLQMHHHPETDTFTAVAYGWLMNKKVLHFRANELCDPGNLGIMTTAYVGKHPLLFDTIPDSFKSQEAYRALISHGKAHGRIPELAYHEAQQKLKERREKEEENDVEEDEIKKQNVQQN